MPVINQDQIILSPPLRPLNYLTPDGTNPNGIKRPLVQENVLKHHAARDIEASINSRHVAERWVVFTHFCCSLLLVGFLRKLAQQHL